MKLGLHTYSLNMHGIGQAWVGFTSPWPRQLSTFKLFDLIDGSGPGRRAPRRWGAGTYLEPTYLQEVGSAAREAGLYLEYNFSMDRGEFGVGIQHDLDRSHRHRAAPWG
jgi:hypothetical protein